jgi:hypothetical protein
MNIQDNYGATAQWLKTGISRTAFGGSLPYQISVKYVERIVGDAEEYIYRLCKLGFVVDQYS